MTHAGVVTVPSPSARRPLRSGPGSCFLLLGLVAALLVLAPHLSAAVARWPGATGLAGRLALGLGAAGLVALAWSARRALYQTLTSLAFAVASLTTLLLATAVGTLVLQKGRPEEYVAAYGAGAARVLRWLSLDDLFHSTWFNGWLALLGLSLCLVAVRNRAWRPPMWGHLMGHLGVVVLLVGGMVGNLGGLRGVVELREGEQTDTLVRTDTLDPAERLVPLGFTLRLLDFSVETHPDAWRLHLYAVDDGEVRLLRSWRPDELPDWTAAGTGDLELRVAGAWPDHERRTELRPAPDGQGAPGLALTLQDAGGPRPVALLAGEDGLDLPDGTHLAFTWEPPDAEALGARAAGVPERHELLVQAGPDATPERLLVRPGERRTLADGHVLEVRRFLPRFRYDLSARTASSPADAPPNPALQVTLDEGGETIAERWLFALHPEAGHAAGADAWPRLTYRHLPAAPARVDERLVVGATGEVWRLAEGRPVTRGPLEEGLADLPVDGLRVLPAARAETVDATRSEDWRQPLVEVQVRPRDGTPTTARLQPGHDGLLGLPGGAGFLALEKRGDDVKAWRSRVAVLDGQGVPVREATIEVNQPLHFGGVHVFQSSHRSDDPTWSGLLVVRDPGLPLVFTGFVLLVAGVVFVYTVRPRLLRGRAA